ncbi:hypothetical protein TruAng_004186 [Truncatella angustata]|nr:hypothetical protein TruAng_004186 [Truncatella angustata]
MLLRRWPSAFLSSGQTGAATDPGSPSPRPPALDVSALSAYSTAIDAYLRREAGSYRRPPVINQPHSPSPNHHQLHRQQTHLTTSEPAHSLRQASVTPSNSPRWQCSARTPSSTGPTTPSPTHQPKTTLMASENTGSTHTDLLVPRYTDNGGSTLAIAGKDFAIMAGDTRLTAGYSINTRYSPKVFKIGGSNSSQDDANILLSVVGFAADGEALKERLDAIVKMYRYRHNKPMSVSACAKRLSTIMYQRRFFPYYVYAILGGLDENGEGAVYSYDPVGSYEREQCRAGGAASSLIMPFLDNQVNFKNQHIPGSGIGHALQERPREPLPREEVEILVKDAFDSAVERHIEVGDGLQLMIITSNGIEEKILPLKKD